MKLDIAEKLVAALESGEFKQARQSLRRDDGYCCLGVLCELYRREHPDIAEWDTVAFGDAFAFRINGSPSFSVLPELVMDWAGMRSDSGHYRPELGIAFPEDPSLATTNDSGASFLQIAQIIRDNVERL